MDLLWCEPGQGFSDDWLGFRRSVDKRDSGRFYAQCKYCSSVCDGRLPNLRKHKLICPEFGQSGAETETYYEDGTIVEQDYDTQIVVKSEPKAAKRKRQTFPKSPKLSAVTPTKSTYMISTPTIATHAVHHHQSPAPPQIKSRFADTARVWERKLCDLPLPQALQIEKNVNDMLYEATLANIQYQTPAAINVNITTTGTEEATE